MLDIERMDVLRYLLCVYAHKRYSSIVLLIQILRKVCGTSLIGIYGMSLCSMKSVIDRYGRGKEEEQLVANPNTELKVCHYE
jgi:hypothetical protein